jgi:hypothetical protein
MHRKDLENLDLLGAEKLKPTKTIISLRINA